MGIRTGPAAVITVLAAAALPVATVALDVVSGRAGVPGSEVVEAGSTTALTGLVQLVPGLLVLRSLPRHPVAWVLIGSGLLWMLDGFAAAWAFHAVYVAPGLPGASAAYWFYLRFGAVLLLGLPLLLLLFPDGRLPAGRVWRPLSIASLASTAALPAVLVVVPSADAQRFHGEPLPPRLDALALDPVSIAMPYWPEVLTTVYALAPLGLVVPFAAVVARYRAADGVRRLQLRWLVWAGLVDALVMAVAFAVPEPLPMVLLTIAVAVTSAAIVAAITRYRLYEIDRLLSTTLVTAMLAVLVVAVDLVVLAVAGNLLAGRDSAFLAVAVVAVAYTPLRNRLWSAARRLVRGSRDDPYATVSTLAERLELAAGPDEQLAAVAVSVAETFRLSYVRVEIATPEGGRRSVEHGTPTGRTLTLPVVYRGEPVGLVELPSAASLSERDQRLFGDLVRQAAAAARASELSVALQQSRRRLVTAREEERRRLRRDLHDSLGPGLGAVTLRIETARNLAAADPDAADAMLRQATTDVAAALHDVRRLVHDLRPPALDERGLLRAVEQQAQRLSGDDLRIDVTAMDDVAGLPAAVEVAAYRIASEALTNVHRHAAAAHCTVVLERDAAELRVEVRDDGVGIGDDVAAGVGMLSLRERAAELGGDCSVGCPPGGGTVVRARLPLAGDAVIGEGGPRV